MKRIEDGIAVTKAELAALLEFSSDDEKSQMSQVRFTCEGGFIRAYATDGHRAVEAEGVSEDGADGEWSVERGFLELVKKTLSGDQRAILMVTGASLRDVRIEAQDEESLEWSEASALSWPRDAASSQITIESLRQVMKLPEKTRDIARCVTVSPLFLGAISLIGKAAESRDSGCDVYLQTRNDPVTFRIESPTHQTTWTGVIMPMRGVEEKVGRDAAE